MEKASLKFTTRGKMSREKCPRGAPTLKELPPRNEANLQEI